MRPSFFKLRSILQTVGLIIFLTLAVSSGILVSVFNLLLFIGYAIYSFIRDNFNYKRAWAGHCITTVGLVWHTVMCIAVLGFGTHLAFTLTHLIGLLVILTAGYSYLAHRFSKLILSEKYEYWDILYQFGFGFQSKEKQNELLTVLNHHNVRRRIISQEIFSVSSREDLILPKVENVLNEARIISQEIFSFSSREEIPLPEIENVFNEARTP